MKNQSTIIVALVLLLSGTSCIKDRHRPTTVTVSTFAGSGMQGSADGIGISASFNDPNRIAIDVAGNLYVTEFQSGFMRKISSKAEVTTLTGVALVHPSGVAVDASGYLYTGDDSYTINKISPDATSIRTLAGNGLPGSVDGEFTAAKFNGTKDMAFDAAGNLFLSDSGNNKIRKVSPTGAVTTFAGSGARGAADGKGTTASFDRPDGIGVDAAGNLYVADTYNNLIRKISPTGIVTTLAGSGKQGGDDGTGRAASFNLPAGIGLDASGNIYVADYGNNKIREVTPQGLVTTLAGSGELGTDNGPGSSASFTGPSDVAVDPSGRIFVVEPNHIRLIEVKQTNF